MSLKYEPSSEPIDHARFIVVVAWGVGRSEHHGKAFSSSYLLLSRLELSDTQVYEP